MPAIRSKFPTTPKIKLRLRVASYLQRFRFGWSMVYGLFDWDDIQTHNWMTNSCRGVISRGQEGMWNVNSDMNKRNSWVGVGKEWGGEKQQYVVWSACACGVGCWWRRHLNPLIVSGRKEGISTRVEVATPCTCSPWPALGSGCLLCAFYWTVAVVIGNNTSRRGY